MNKLNSISFVIFTYNSADIIERNLNHIKAALDFNQIEYEIILVDNNSTDITLDLVSDFSKENEMKIKIIENPRQGLAFSRVEGIKIASKEYVTFIDDDNFISENWVKKLAEIVTIYKPDVIGCQTIGIANIPFPTWWEKNKGTYACGKRFDFSGNLTDPLQKLWGAGLTARRKYLEPALLKMDLLCTGRIGKKQMSGDDAELNYRMRLMGARFYNSNLLVLKHYMRQERLTKEHLMKIREGSAYGAINLDVYKYLLTNKRKYKLFNMAILILLGTPILSFRYKINYLKFALLRFKTLKQRQIIQKKIKTTFLTQ